MIALLFTHFIHRRRSLILLSKMPLICISGGSQGLGKIQNSGILGKQKGELTDAHRVSPVSCI